MIPIKHTLVKLLPKDFVLGDTKAVYDSEKKKISTEHMTIDQPSDFEPSLWASDRGVVVSTSHPDVQVGDIVFFEYLAVTQALGRWFESQATADDPHFILNGKYNNSVVVKEFEHLEGLHIFVADRFIIWLERDGKELTVNEFNVIETIELEQSSVVSMVKLRVNFAVVHIGEFKGYTVCFSPNKRYGLAQGLLYKGKKVEVILSRYIDATI